MRKASRLGMTDLLEIAAMKGTTIPTIASSSGAASSGASSSGEPAERSQSAPTSAAPSAQQSSAASSAPEMVEDLPMDGEPTPIS